MLLIKATNVQAFLFVFFLNLFFTPKHILMWTVTHCLTV